LTQHIDDATLARFTAGELSEGGEGEVMTHAAACPACMERILSRRFDESDDGFGVPTPAALARLGEIRRARIAAASDAKALFEELEHHPPLRRTTMVRNSSRYDSAAFVRVLLTRVRQLVFERPEESVQLGSLGVEIAERLSVEDNPALTADLRGQAWLELANARRVTSDLRGARQAFDRAAHWIEAGSHDPLDEAMLAELMMSILYNERRFEESLRFARSSLRLRARCGNAHLSGRSHMAISVTLSSLGRNEEALEHGERALSLLDAEAEPAVYTGLVINLATALEELDRIPQAIAIVARARNQATYDRTGRVRLRWLEAKLARKTGRSADARQALEEVCDEWLELGMADNAAQTALELATLHLEEGRTAEVKLLAARTLPIFQSLGIHREALAAYSLLQRAAEAETLTAALLAQLDTYFRELKYRQAIPFHPDSTGSAGATA
jgi:tetratricopeptide (TPR) repeat protein